MSISSDNMTSTSALFKDIQRDGRICNHCFLKNYDEYTHYDDYSITFDDDEMVVEPGRNADVVEESRETTEHVQETNRDTWACTCGEMDYGKRRPLSLEQAVDIAHNLSETLVRRGYAHDTKDLVRAVTRRKRDPDNQMREDTDVFGAAVNEVIDNA